LPQWLPLHYPACGRPVGQVEIATFGG
jgi:hypothetical protein